MLMGMHRRGIVLLVVLGVLGVMVVLATTFVTMATLERRASQQRLHATRAFLLARSGLEDALARISAGQDPEAAQVASSDALNPGRYDVIVERAGGFFVNAGAPEEDPTLGYNAVLRRMLGTLAKAIDEEQGGLDANPVSEADGWALVDARPRNGTGWENWQEILHLLGQSKHSALRPYLALHAWSDRRVIRPNVPALLEGRRFERQGDLLLAHPAPGFERAASGRILGRAPVDFGWARRRRPALLALLGGLKGLYLEQLETSVLGTLRPAELRLDWTPTDDAHVAADFIATWTSPVESWTQFATLCSEIPFTSPLADPLADPLAALQQQEACRDLLMAQFNPNTALNKFNPSDVRWKRLDKSDLLAYSTELALMPVCGWEISSRGRVLDAGGRLLAMRELGLTLAPPQVVRLSTQRELLCEDAGNLQFPGDEGEARRPGSAPFLSESRGLGTVKTWGHRLASAGWMNGNSNGASLQSYPEPLPCPPSDTDGYLETATLETPSDSFYGVPPPGADLGFLARFDDSFDLDIARSGVIDVIEDVQTVRPAERSNSVWDPVQPNTLFPDGAYSERERTPAYFDKGSIPGKHGLIAFWIRPLGRCFVEAPLVHATNYSETPYATGSNQFFMLTMRAGPFGVLGWGFQTCTHFELTHDPLAEGNGEYEYILYRYQYPGRLWHHVAFYYDLEATGKHATGELAMDGGLKRIQSYGMAAGAPTTFTSDLTEDDILGPHRIALGGGHPGTPDDIPDNDQNPHYGGAQATFDEFAIYDFGRTENAVGNFALRRYRDGRYYKGSAYERLGVVADEQAPEYFSPRLSLPPGSCIRRVDWTFLAPTALPDDFLETALVSADASRYLGDPASSRSVTAPEWTTALQSWGPRLLVGREPFRLQAIFRRLTPIPYDVPIVDPPSLDDMTVVADPPGGPRILEWRGAAETP